MLFQKEHVLLILQGKKTQTRRLWQRPMVKVGGTYWAETKMFRPSSRFARLTVIRLWKERLEDISEKDARAEGYTSVASFLTAFATINRIRRDLSWLRERVTCVELELAPAGEEKEVVAP